MLTEEWIELCSESTLNVREPGQFDMNDGAGVGGRQGQRGMGWH